MFMGTENTGGLSGSQRHHGGIQLSTDSIFCHCAGGAEVLSFCGSVAVVELGVIYDPWFAGVWVTGLAGLGVSICYFPLDGRQGVSTRRGLATVSICQPSSTQGHKL